MDIRYFCQGVAIALNISIVAFMLKFEDNVITIADNVRTVSAAGKVTVALGWISRPLGENVEPLLVSSQFGGKYID